LFVVRTPGGMLNGEQRFALPLLLFLCFTQNQPSYASSKCIYIGYRLVFGESFRESIEALVCPVFRTRAAVIRKEKDQF
jgi:hypothetical protein